jgi:RNA polymerase sigma-70 factor (ECF subfamily)
MTESFDPSEFDCIARALVGDEAAFKELFDTHRARLHGVAFRILRNHGDAEDVVQEAFARAFRKLGAFRQDCPLATWLHSIAVNAAHNRYWYFRRRFRHASVVLGEEIAAPFADPAESAADAEWEQRIAFCLDGLPPIYRDVIAARFLRHRTYGQIAAALAINVGTVKSRLSRARHCLRRRLAAA